MFLNKKVIAIIPAKHRSHELPKKNYLKLNNKSLFEISIISALQSHFIDQVYVTSDSKIILEKSKNIGANIIKRSKNLCSKKSTANQVIKDVIDKIKKENNKDYYIIYLQPTSPFRNHLHINKAFNLLKKNKLKSIVSVEKNLKTIYKNIKIQSNIIRPIFNKKFINANRQELPETYITNGAIYIFLVTEFLKKNKIPVFNSLAYKMSGNVSADIDSLMDYNYANKMSKKFLIY